MSELAVEVEQVEKSFGKVQALAGLDLAIDTGTIFGLLGPNGAGKTTLVRILATLIEPSAGRARVLGHDVVSDQLAVRRRIGLAGQFAAVDNELTGFENLEMVGRLSRLAPAEARRRATESLERYGLTDAADRRASTYSGGMRRRLDLAAGLIGRPPVVLLDEPTSGLDPRSRQDLWASIEELRREGTTVLLTTQYLEEADRLAERIALIDHGRIAAEGSPSELKKAIGRSVLSVHVADTEDLEAAAETLAPLMARVDDPGHQTQLGSPTPAATRPPESPLGDDRPRTDAATGEVTLAVVEPGAAAEAVRRLDHRQLAIAAIELREPSLDDVFMALTGHPTDDGPDTLKEAA